MKTYLIFFIILVFILSEPALSQQLSYSLSLKEIQIHSLKKEGSRNTFSLETGGCATFRVQPVDASILIRVRDPGGKVLREYSESMRDGALPMDIQAEVPGNYSVEVLPLESDTAGVYRIQLLSLNDAAACAAQAIRQQKDDPQIISWIQQDAIPISTVDPIQAESQASNFNDLMPLKKVLSTSQVIGLGETTHGTSEFYKFKHRMLQFLYQEMNCTAIVFEDGYTEGLAINQYVVYGKGNLDSVMKLMHSVWDTQELSDMIEWMHDHNQTAPDEKKIRFYGMDVIDPNLPDSVQMYFDKFVPELSMKVKQILTGFNTISNDSFIMMEPEYKWVGDYLQKNKNSLVEKSGEEIFNHAFIESQIMIQQVAMAKAGALSPQVRDSAMALTAQMILKSEKTGSRIIVYAHNGHVGAGGEEVHSKQTGYFLRQLLREKYYAVGFFFDQGTFNAIKYVAGEPFSAANISDDSKFRNFTVSSVPQENIERYFVAANIPMFFLDLRATNKPAAVNDWMNRIQITRSISTLYDDEAYATFSEDPVLLKTDYDGIFFIDKTTASRRRMK